MRDLEKRSGVSNSLISQIESGYVENPGIKTVVALAGPLGIPAKRIIEAVEKK